jgi:ferredoxin
MLETLLPVGIITAILFSLTVVLLIADRFLVSYGDCKVSVEAEEGNNEFVVQGGTTLLSILIDQGMEIPASCGGRGSCGFCKLNVRSGGGDILPTEEMFISKEEKKTGTRLACQVKVKEDIELFVPDLISTVKGMADTDTFDTRSKWTFAREGVMQVAEDKKKAKLARTEKNQVLDIVDRHRDEPGPILPILHDVNSAFNYLPEASAARGLQRTRRAAQQDLPHRHLLQRLQPRPGRQVQDHGLHRHRLPRKGRRGHHRNLRAGAEH